MFIPIGASEYVRWLTGFVDNGGEITHQYDYPIKNARFVRATCDFVLKPGFGSDSKNILVPRHVKWTGSVGHDTLYLMDGFKIVGSWVPSYNDTEFLFV